MWLSRFFVLVSSCRTKSSLRLLIISKNRVIDTNHLPQTQRSNKAQRSNQTQRSNQGLSWPKLVGQPGVGLGGADRPGPAHQMFRGWAAEWLSPSHFQKIKARPAGPIIFSKATARPGLAHHMATRPMKHGLYMGRPDNYVGRPTRFPVLKGAGAYDEVTM